MKVLKNDPLFNNEYGFVVYEFLRNSYSAPNNRSLLQFIALVDSNSVESKDIFIEKCQAIYEKFITYFISQIESEVESAICNIETLDEEKKSCIELDIKTESIASQQFIQEVEKTNYNTEEKGLIITLNNYDEMDLDFYFVKN
jgi:hypothetical protein